jgi:hypothetical protein
LAESPVQKSANKKYKDEENLCHDSVLKVTKTKVVSQRKSTLIGTLAEWQPCKGAFPAQTGINEWKKKGPCREDFSDCHKLEGFLVLR